MEYTIQQEQETGIILARVTGEWNAQQDNQMLVQIMKMPSAGLKLVLLDLSQMESNFSVFYIYNRAEFLSKRREGADAPSFKAALIYNDGDPKVAQAYQFFETATRNRGMPYRVFSDIEQARRWLLEA